MTLILRDLSFITPSLTNFSAKEVLSLVLVSHRELFEIPIWELNGKFPIIGKYLGQEIPFLGYCWEVVDP